MLAHPTLSTRSSHFITVGVVRRATSNSTSPPRSPHTHPSAYSRTINSKSAPLNPRVNKPTSSSTPVRTTPYASMYISTIATRSRTFGGFTSTSLSKRPARRNASSSLSRAQHVPNTTTRGFVRTPSMLVSSCATTWLFSASSSLRFTHIASTPSNTTTPTCSADRRANALALANASTTHATRPHSPHTRSHTLPPTPALTRSTHSWMNGPHARNAASIYFTRHTHAYHGTLPHAMLATHQNAAEQTQLELLHLARVRGGTGSTSRSCGSKSPNPAEDSAGCAGCSVHTLTRSHTLAPSPPPSTRSSCPRRTSPPRSNTRGPRDTTRFPPQTRLLAEGDSRGDTERDVLGRARRCC